MVGHVFVKQELTMETNTPQEQDDIITDCADVLGDFFENIIQTILCVRGVYPRDLFHETVSSVTGQIALTSRHPTLSQYVKGVVRSIKPWLRLGLIDKVIITIYGNIQHSNGQEPDKKKLEAFEFEVSDLRINLFEEVTIDSQLFGTLFWALRDFFVKVHALQPLDLSTYDIEPDSLSFDVHVQADRSSQLQLPSKLDWSIVQPDEEHEMITGECILSPVKHMNNENMGIKMSLNQKQWKL
jgi:hypothetical protein